MIFRSLFGICLIASTTPLPAQERRIDPPAAVRLVLSAAEWSCAVDLAKAKRREKVALFQLSPKVCNGRYRSTIDPILLDSQRPQQSFYLLRWQMDCLVERGAQAKRDRQAVVFDFREQRCP